MLRIILFNFFSKNIFKIITLARDVIIGSGFCIVLHCYAPETQDHMYNP
jgi:hypothetical protein